MDNWSVGCIFAELLLGKPLLQGKTEMEQLDLIFKLCGTPTAGEVSKETRELPHAAAFLNAKKPHQRRVQEVFRRQPKVRGFLFFFWRVPELMRHRCRLVDSSDGCRLL